MNKQVGKQFGEDNPSALLPSIRVETVTVAERRYHTAFPVSGDASTETLAGWQPKYIPESLTSVASGAGPFPPYYDAETRRAIERDTFGRV